MTLSRPAFNSWGTGFPCRSYGQEGHGAASDNKELPLSLTSFAPGRTAQERRAGNF